MNGLLGIDIGGTKCAVVLGEADEFQGGSERQSAAKGITIVDRTAFPTEVGKGKEYTLNNIKKAVYSILERNNIRKHSLKSIGISCGGPLDSKRGIIMSPPNLIGWNNVEIVKIIENEFGVKARLQNDANACALAEWKFGAGRGLRNIVFLTFGTGMGAGLILDGRLYSGTNDMAGEVGHVRLENIGPVGYGKAGSFEGFCSGGGIAQLARMKALEKLQKGEKVPFCSDIDSVGSLDAKTVAEAALAGDETAAEIYRISGCYLGRGLSILIDILNPEVIIIGSIFTRSRDLLWPAADEVIKRESLALSRSACRIALSELGNEIGDYAAIAAGMN